MPNTDQKSMVAIYRGHPISLGKSHRSAKERNVALWAIPPLSFGRRAPARTTTPLSPVMARSVARSRTKKLRRYLNIASKSSKLGRCVAIAARPHGRR